MTLHKKPLVFPHTYQSDAPLEVHNTYQAQKWARGFENDATSTLSPTSLENNLLTITARTNLDNAVVTPTSDYPAKRSCLDKSIEKMHKLVISSTLASYIGTRIPWDKDADIVLLGSPSLRSESHTIGTSPSELLDDVDIEDTYFAENGIRYANLLYECKTSAKILLAMDCWTLTSSWSSVHCSLLYTLPNAQIMLCVYSIAYFTYKSCKSRRQ